MEAVCRLVRCVAIPPPSRYPLVELSGCIKTRGCAGRVRELNVLLLLEEIFSVHVARPRPSGDDTQTESSSPIP